MNILFANHSDFGSNSLNHIGTFANRLTLLGHACVVAVPENPETISALADPLFVPTTFARALDPEPLFPDRRPADILHVWTPRELLREFTLSFLRLFPATTLVIHLEDNEVFLMESYAHAPLSELCALSDEELSVRLSNRLCHPTRFRNFLRLAHATTFITDRLREFVPEGKPAHRLLPGIDPAHYRPLPSAPNPELRLEIGAKEQDKLIVFTGSTNFANLADIRTLMIAVRLINNQGVPCKLVRTGINPPQFVRELAAIGGDHIIELGFIDKARLAPLLALADVLVQPGAPDAFNDYRLPSKLPEFLSMGRPVITTRANLGREMEDGRHALLLDTGTPAEIAEKCLRVFNDPALARRLGEGALEFARAHFELEANTTALLAFYEHVKSTAQPLRADDGEILSEDVLLSEGDTALRMRAKELTIAHLHDRVGDLRRELSAWQARSNALEGELTARQNHVNNIEAALAARQNHIDTLQANITSLEAELAARQNSITAFQSKLATLEGELASRRDRITALEGELTAQAESMGALRRRDVDGLQSEISALRAEQARQGAMHAARESYSHAKFQAERNQVEVLRRQLTDAAPAMARLMRELDDAKARHEATIAELRQRDDKVRRMTRSFSWRATSPLRSLRRLILDPILARRIAAPEPLPAPDPTLTSVIDEPADRGRVSPAGALRGWVIGQAGLPIVGVRARIGQKAFDGEYGVARPDVAAAHPGQANAKHCGFAIECVLPPESDQNIIIESLTEDGVWRCVATFAAHVTSEAPEHLRRDYATWVSRFDTLSLEQMVDHRARIESLSPDQRPLLSVLMPTYNTPEPWLVQAIESVRAQLYPHWELCIADDASTTPHVRRVLEDYLRRDTRIKVVFREENGHISAASNSALDLATGTFAALLDHDDELAPHALAEVAYALAASPQLEFLYSDEDKIDENGRRHDPYFKPDWNPDLLLSQNYTCHLSVFRTARLRSIGGFRAGFEGSQDWDLTLRATETLAPERVHHIPRVLYHWRAIPGSTALIIDQKNDYPFVAAKKALAEHLARTGVAAELVAVAGRHWRVKRQLPSPAPKVSIVIPTRNAESLLRLGIGSILTKTTYPNFEIIVVNNRSDDAGTLKYFEELRAVGVRVIDCDAPFNFSALNNLATREAKGTLLAFLNNDLEVISPDWLEEMATQALRPEIGAVGAMLYYPNDTVQHAGAVLGLTGPARRDGVAGHGFKCSPRGSEGQRNRLRLVQNYSAVTAACLVIRREVFDAVGAFNEADLSVAFNDIDLCLRVRAAGYRNLWTPFAEFYHHESASRGAEDTPEKVERFQREVTYMRRKWGRLLDRDPAYNPNLTGELEDFSLAFPPRLNPTPPPDR